MDVCVTGGTGFIGTHLVRRLADAGHGVVIVSRGTTGTANDLLDREHVEFVETGIANEPALRAAFADVDVVAHLAGIAFERGSQTFDRVHVEGTKAVASAAERADVDRVVSNSFLRARPGCGSTYHETKWAAEETLRSVAVESAICKTGMVYGPGDHVVAQLSRTLATVPVFPLVGRRERRMRPVAVDDVVDVLVAAITDGTLDGTTVPVVGPEPLTLETFVERLGRAMGRKPRIVWLPVVVHRLVARLGTTLMETPPVAPAQVRMLAEGLVDPAPADVCSPLPASLEPDREPTVERIERALPEIRRYTLGDTRLVG